MPCSRPLLVLAWVFLLLAAPASGQTPPALAPLPRGAVSADQFGDPLPPGAVARIGGGGLRHTQNVNQLLFLPDGATLVSCSDDGTIRLWDPATGKELRRFVGHRGPVAGIAVTRNGALLASGGGHLEARADNDTSIRLWDVDTGQEVGRIDGHGQRVSSVAFAPDGETLVSGSYDGTIAFWDVPTAREVHRIRVKEGPIYCVAYSPDGQTVASGGAEVTPGGGLRLWDAVTGKERPRLIPEDVEPRAPGDVRWLWYVPGGGHLLSSGRDQRVWDLDAGKEALRYGPHAGAGGGRAVPFAIVVDAATSDWKLAFFATAAPSVAVLDWETQTFTGHLTGPAKDCWCLALDPGGRRVAAGGRGAIYVWDVATKQALGPPRDKLVRAALSPDGALTATRGTSSLTLWETLTGLPLHTARVTGAGPLAFAPDGRAVAAAERGLGPLLWDLPVQNEPRRCEKQGEIDALVFTHGGGSLMGFRVFDGIVVFWDVATGKAEHFVYLPPPEGTWYTSAVFSPDGSLLAAPLRDTQNRYAGVGVWDTASGALRHHLKLIDQRTLLAFSPDGKTLALANQNPISSIRLFETATGRRRGEFGEQGHPYQHLAFAPGGRHLAAVSADGVPRLWDLSTGMQRAALGRGRNPTTALAFSDEGSFLVSGEADTTGLVWNVAGLNRPLPPAALTPQELDAHWANLAGADAEKAYHAFWQLTAAAGQSLPALHKRLPPEPSPDPQRLARLLADLDSPRFAARQKASEELERLGRSVETALREALAAQPTLEVTERLEKLLAKMELAELTTEQVRGLRGVEVLEHVGTPEARRLLEGLSQGAPDARLTREARNAVGRLVRRSR